MHEGDCDQTTVQRQQEITRPKLCYRWMALALFIAFYLPFAWGGSHVFLPVHDNLDGEVPHSRVLGLFYRDPKAAEHLLLGGRLPIILLPRLTWPLSLLNITGDPLAAYVTNDVAVRLVAFAGMFLLTKRIGVGPDTAFFAGLLFSVTLTYSVLGLSVAGIPLVIYLVQKSSDQGASPRRLAALLMVGWNSALALSGVFLLVSLPFLKHAFFGTRKRLSWTAYGTFALGLALGSAGLLAAMTTRLPLNRNEWVLSGVSGPHAVRTFFANQFSMSTWDFYHVSTPLVFAYVAMIVAAVVIREKRILFCLAGVLSIGGFYSFAHWRVVAQIRNHLWGTLRTFQIDRFYMLVSCVTIVGWAMAAASKRTVVRRAALVLGATQLACALVLTPHLRNAIESLTGYSDLPSYREYYRFDDYRAIRSVIGQSVALSVALDPMAAVMNGISTLDGYYSAYPLNYKKQWRRVIEKQLTITHLEPYFDGWGNRIYTFVDSPAAISLNYCAAYAMGARYVISAFPLPDTRLSPVTVTKEHNLALYSIRCGADGNSLAMTRKR